MNLHKLWEQRVNGSLEREKYWNHVKESLEVLEQVAGLLRNSRASITVSQEGIKMTYGLSNERKISFFVDPADTRSVGVAIVADGRYEELFERALIAIAPATKRFLDVGANAGFYSLAVASASEKCEVLAFEPNPKIAERLIENISLNCLSGQIRHVPLALSNIAGKATFYVPQYTGTGGGSLRNLHPDEGTPETFEVNLETLDSLSLDKIDLIKIDVEGNEMSVIQGAKSTIQRDKPTIFVELLRKWMKPFGAHPQDVVNLLAGEGYLLFEIAENSINRLHQIDENTIPTNFIFIHSANKIHMDLLSEFNKEIQSPL